MLAEASEVGGGCIALVLLEAVAGEVTGKGVHEPVAGDLGDDAGGGDTAAGGVSANEGGLGDRKWVDGQTVDEGVAGLEGEGQHGFAHRGVGGTEDVQAIDLGWVAVGGGPGDEGIRDEVVVEPVAGEGGEFLRIVETAGVEPDREDDGGGNNGSSQRPAARFVNADDGGVPQVDEALLGLEGAGHGSLGGKMGRRPPRRTGSAGAEGPSA
jgi:hypothetical protein